jgi:hypothetical protein
VKILSKTKVDLAKDKLEYLLEVNRFQLECRYPDYLENINKICDLNYKEKNLKRIKVIKECLIEHLQ